MVLFLLACTPDDGFTTIGPDGGTLEAAGVSLSVPAGALSSDTPIRIVETGDAPEGYEGLSSLYTFEPDGLTFATPATVQIPYEAHDLPRMYWSDGDGYAEVDAAFDDGIARAAIEHFSGGFVAITPIETVEQTFEQRPMDVVFVVDNSCSMYPFQQRLSNHDIPVLDALHGTADFHLGLVSTDMHDLIGGNGKLRHHGSERFITSVTPSPLVAFDAMANMGTNGFYDEEGRDAAYQLLEIARDTPSNSGFYRPDASLDIVFLSDEEDQSDDTDAAGFVDWMLTLKEHAFLTRAHAIVHTASLCTEVGTEGLAYQGYAVATGGYVQDLCAVDWTPVIDAITVDRIGQAVVTLPVVPSELVSVRLEGVSDVELDPADYEQDGAVVRLSGAVRPVPGDTIVVRYRP